MPIPAIRGLNVSLQIDITCVSGKADLEAFIDLAYRLNAHDQNWVPPLRTEMVELLTPGKNPFHDHARVQYFLARRGGKVVGRISAHIDELALAQPPEQGMGPGTGNWGLLEAEDETVTAALIARAEGWLRDEGMTRVLAPISLSIWEEPGLLVKGHDHPPTVMMGHHDPRYQGWIEAQGYEHAKSLYTYDLDVTKPFPDLVRRIVEMGERSPRITIRNVDMKNYERDVAIVIDILNDAWSDNWGFVPFTEREKKYAAKKQKPLVLDDLNKIAELDGEAVAFMMVLPDINELLIGMGGKLLPFNWAKLLWWLRRPRPTTMRVPLMGVAKRLQGSRMASQLAFMLIESIRRSSEARYQAKRGEIGWILDDNQGMVAIADAIESKINREYVIYQKSL
jgi:GNAT superfamily N-acetyltransferase